MGNELSHAKDYTVCKDPTGTVSEWVLYEGRKNVAKSLEDAVEENDANVLDDISGNVVTVFVGKLESKTSATTEYLRNNVKTLMKLRHPDLVRFLTWRETPSRLELVTEHVRPLAEVRDQLTELDISGGLLALLRALNFLHTQAYMCHNNVCQASVFVTASGAWRLGAAEFALLFVKETPERLRDSSPHRYQPAIPPEESQPPGKDMWWLTRPWTRDVYAFGVLVSELIEPCVKSDFPGARGLLTYVQRHLLAPDPLCRPDIADFQHHEFFHNDFNQIVEFLENLVLKSPTERRQFFADLTTRLRAFPDELVASRLSTLLLSRMVLLDEHACAQLLPGLFTPRQGTGEPAAAAGVLPVALFRRWVLPQLLRIFHVRDLHIRLVLLRHFHSYAGLIPPHTLAETILPELLLGIRDSDDRLVAATLRALADAVPILGAQQVIGSHRLKMFGDGNPKASRASATKPVVRAKRPSMPERRPAVPERRATLLELAQKAPPSPLESLPERRSPDGGERPLSEDEEPADWSDWEAADVAEPLVPPPATPPTETAPLPLDAGSPLMEEVPAATSTPARPAAGRGGSLKLSGARPQRKQPQPAARPPEDEFERFSIQVRKRDDPADEDDLFADMQPVIRKAATRSVFGERSAPAVQGLSPRVSDDPFDSWGSVSPVKESAPLKPKLDMSFQPADSDSVETGWGDEDWGDELQS